MTLTEIAAPHGKLRNRLWGAALCLATFVVLWICLLPRLGNSYSADSYAYALLGQSIFKQGTFESISVRDFHGIQAVPQPSRSFPPLWPLVVGLAQVTTGTEIEASVYANAIVLFATLAVMLALARRLGGRLWPLIFFAFPAFFLINGAYRGEVAGGRAIPLTGLIWLLLLITLVRIYSAQTPLRRDAVGLGILLAALPLTRFDQLPISLLLAALFAAALWAKTPTPASLKIIGLAGLAMLATYAPWAIRNYQRFGTPLASDNTETALSTWAGGPAALTEFAPGQTPPGVRENPVLWARQRLDYLRHNLRILWRDGKFLLLLLPPAGWLAWRRREPGDWLLLAAVLLSAAATLAGLSLTPYHDTRYFALTHLNFFLIGGLTAARLMQTCSRTIVSLTVGMAMCLAAFILAWRLPPGSFAQLAAHPSSNLLAIRPSPHLNFYAEIMPPLLARTGRETLVAAESAELFSFHTGLNSIYLPHNNVGRDIHFSAWLRRWKPAYIFASMAWVDKMELHDWRVTDWPRSDLLLLIVPAHESAAPDARLGGGGLAEFGAEPDRHKARILLRLFFQELEAPILRAVIHQDDLKADR